MNERIFVLCQKFFNQSDRLANWDEVAKIYVPVSLKKVFEFFRKRCPMCNIKAEVYQVVVMAKNQEGEPCGRAKILPVEKFGRNLRQEAIVDLKFFVCSNGHGCGQLITMGAHTYSLPHYHEFLTAV